MKNKLDITIYNFAGSYGFSYEIRNKFYNIVGNKNPNWLKFIAKVIWNLGFKKLRIRL